jgi:branched-chain amino acid transport system ATP-binding protein
MEVLEVNNVTAGYDKEIDVLYDVSFSINLEESVALMGANGAGKSTTLKLISGLLHPRRGKICYKGERIDHLEPHEIVERGIIQIPEEQDIFDSLTVEENLIVSCQTKRSKINKDKNFVFTYQTFPILKTRHTQFARTLSGGERKMLAVGKAIMAEPKMLLLDDISTGLAPKVVGTLYSRLEELKSKLNIPVLIVEQNVEIALNLSERAYVLSAGQIVMNGTSRQLKESEEVRKSYIGA